jgi:hypothetical protein
MSIIRSNIARQLLAEGGAPRKPFARGGREDAESQYGSGSVDSYSYSEPTSVSGGDYEDDVARMEASMNINQPPGSLSDEDAKALSYVNFNRPTRTPDRFTFGIPEGFSPFPILTGITKGIQGIDNFIGKATNRDRYNLSRRTDFLRKEGVIGPGEEDEKYTDEFLLSPEGLDMLKGMGYTTIQDVINNRGEGGDSEPIKRLRAPITEKIEEEPELSDIENLLRYRGSAFEDGGEVRQKFGLGGLGKVFKKAKNVVKKVAKSPIGKAALIGGLGFLGSKTAVGGDLFTKFKNLDNIQKMLLLGGTAATLSPFAMKDEEEDETLPEVARSDPRFQSLINYYGGPTRFAAQGGDIDEAPMKDMPQQEMASYGYNDAMSDTYDMFLQMKEKQLIPPGMDFQEFLQEVVPEMSKRQGIERAQAAGGGMMNPNDEMLNLGGNEMDLRGGGFVPLGEYEKKDDVPARLSKNEFVFTADAVRAAGGGSVDRGADLMYKTMKNLENKIA